MIWRIASVYKYVIIMSFLLLYRVSNKHIRSSGMSYAKDCQLLWKQQKLGKVSSVRRAWKMSKRKRWTNDCMPMRIWNITMTWSLKKRVKGSVLKFTILQLNPTRPTGVFLRGILKVEFHFIRLIWDKVEVLCLFPPCYVLLLAFTYKSQLRDS